MASFHDELKVQMTHGLTLTVMFRSLPVIWQNLGLLSRFGIPGLNGNSVLYECRRETSRSIHCIGVHGWCFLPVERNLATEAAADVASTVMLLSLPLTCPLSCVEPTGILTL